MGWGLLPRALNYYFINFDELGKRGDAFVVLMRMVAVRVIVLVVHRKRLLLVWVKLSNLIPRTVLKSGWGSTSWRVVLSTRGTASLSTGVCASLDQFTGLWHMLDKLHGTNVSGGPIWSVY